MFGLFGKKKNVVDIVTTQDEAPVKSNREIIRENLEVAQRELVRINRVYNEQRADRTKNNETLEKLRLREAELHEAIAVGEHQMSLTDATGVVTKMGVLVEKAQQELDENLESQKAPASENFAIEVFLSGLDNDTTAIESRVTDLKLRLQALEVRESGATIATSLSEGTGLLKDYKREVYTAEAMVDLRAEANLSRS